MSNTSASSVSLSALSDEALVQRAQEGSLPCFAELLRRFEGKIFNFILRRLGGSRSRGQALDAEDLTQDTFLRAWEHLRSFTPRFRFSTWLFTIAGRVTIDHLRSRRVRQEAMQTLRLAATEDADVGDASDDAIEAGSALWNLAEQALTAEPLAALWLRYAEGLSPPEVGRVLGRSQVAVRVMLFRARKTLEAASTHQHQDEPHISANGDPRVRSDRPAHHQHLASSTAARTSALSGGVA